jgi:hypothetical protein
MAPKQAGEETFSENVTQRENNDIQIKGYNFTNKEITRSWQCNVKNYFLYVLTIQLHSCILSCVTPNKIVMYCTNMEGKGPTDWKTIVETTKNMLFI